MPLVGENVRGQDIPFSQLTDARKRALFAQPRPISPRIDQIVEQFLPYAVNAIKTAEGNSSNFGVLTEKFGSTEEAEKILVNSVRNNFSRWLQAGRPGTFVDFFRDRWAPIGATNDPTNLNVNWNDNVRDSLRKQLGESGYKLLEKYNIARLNALANTGVV